MKKDTLRTQSFRASRCRTRALTLATCWMALAACDRQDQQPPSAADYVGEAQCVSCHRSEETHLETAHHKTSQPPSSASITGSFAGGQNVLPTSNRYLHFRMEATDSGFFQTAVSDRPPQVTERSGRFDVVIGSGRKGQSYLHWRGDQLFQLPVSYWTELGTWINSPGYPDGAANFDRPIAPRCLECHATHITARPDSGADNRYEPSSFVPSISCEKCHGPGREHVARMRAGAPIWRGTAIANPASLSRERQIDVCALCHGGIGEQQAPAFSFVAGEPLDAYLRLITSSPTAMLDVHGNQVGLLAQSACFQASAMTCSTCHDVHSVQRDIASFAPACLACHDTDSHPPLRDGRAATIAQRCVECHMPNQTSNTIISTHDGEQLRPEVRTHWIRIYPENGTP